MGWRWWMAPCIWNSRSTLKQMPRATFLKINNMYFRWVKWTSWRNVAPSQQNQGWVRIRKDFPYDVCRGSGDRFSDLHLSCHECSGQIGDVPSGHIFVRVLSCWHLRVRALRIPFNVTYGNLWASHSHYLVSSILNWFVQDLWSLKPNLSLPLSFT